MESIMRVMKRMTGKEEEELRKEWRKEMDEMERELKGLKKKMEEEEKEKPKAKKGGKKAEAKEEEVKEKPKAKKGGKQESTKNPKKDVEKEKAEGTQVGVVEQVMAEREEEEEVEVEEIEYEGTTYLRSGAGIVYDMDTSEEIGRWNYTTNSIEVE